MSKVVNLRLSEQLIKRIDFVAKQGPYSSRTEFVRHALIKAVEEFDTIVAINRLEQNAGVLKKRGLKMPTSEEYKKVREASGNYLLKKHGLL